MKLSSMSEYCLQLMACKDLGFSYILIFNMLTLSHNTPNPTPCPVLMRWVCMVVDLKGLHSQSQDLSKEAKAVESQDLPLKSKSYNQESVSVPDQKRRNSLSMTTIPLVHTRKFSYSGCVGGRGGNA